MSKRQKRKKKKTKQPYGYQPNNPLTIYYKKYIEKEPEIRIKKRAPKRPSSTNKRSKLF